LAFSYPKCQKNKETLKKRGLRCSYGGQIKSVKGNRKNTEFDYVSMTGYDEYGQRVYEKYGNGTEREGCSTS
jgi:hypothetical protein